MPHTPIKKLTNKQAGRGYEVALAALRSISTTIPASYVKEYAAGVVRNLDSGEFLKPAAKVKR